jgi:hypothetical protein
MRIPAAAVPQVRDPSWPLRFLPRLCPAKSEKGAEQATAPRCLVAEIRDFTWRMEGPGFGPAVRLKRDLGASAPEATRLQGLKAHSTPWVEAAGLKPRPSEGHKELQFLLQLSATALLSLGVQALEALS